MNKWIKYGISASILAGFVYLLYWTSISPSETTAEDLQENQQKKEEEQKAAAEEKKRRPIPINPEGMYLIHHLFKGYEKTKKMKPMRSPIASNLPKSSTNAFPNIYMLMGNGSYFSYDDADELMGFIEMGNVAFICSEDIGYSLRSQLFWGDEFANQYSECMDVNFPHDSLELFPDYHWFYSNENGNKYADYWQFWNLENLKYRDFSVISAANVCGDTEGTLHPVCLRINIGKGQLFLHSETLMFTNRILMDENQGLDYAERIMSHLPRGNIYWHELNGKNSHRYLAKKGAEESAQGEGGGSGSYGKRRASPLQFILNSTALRWALYLVLLGLLFYIIFQSKRRRKIIPAAEKRVNSSVEFADTVSQLYYQERRHDKIIKHQEVVFMDFVRNTYYMTTVKADEQFVSGLSRKSGIDPEKIMQIFKAFDYARDNRDINDAFLIKLQKNLDEFYKNCN